MSLIDLLQRIRMTPAVISYIDMVKAFRKHPDNDFSMKTMYPFAE